MKHSNFIISLIISTILALNLEGCNSIFDDAPINKMSEESIWKDPQLLDSYTAGWYRDMSNGFNVSTSNTNAFFLPWIGDQIYVGCENTKTIENFLGNNEKTLQSYSSDIWARTYGKIQIINRLLDNIEKIPEGKQKEMIIGEAHFFLAYHHYNLFRLFGGVFLTNGSYNAQEKKERLTRASYQEMIDYIVKEALLAAEILPVSHDPENIGRITKGASLMLAAKTYMWGAGKPFQNKSKTYLGFTDDQSIVLQKKALEIYDTIEKLNVYQLLEVNGNSEKEIADNYHSIFLQKHSKENILEVQHTNIESHFGHKLDMDAIPPSLGGINTAFTPTQNHVDEYEMRDGSKVDPNNPYQNRDYRFYANIIYDGASYLNKPILIHYINNQPSIDLRPYNGITGGYTKTGYYMRKFLNPNQKLVDNPQNRSSQNYIIWRYAEALLDEAELNFCLGNEPKALLLINKIRKRAHAKPLEKISMETINRERRVELAFEESSYWDILRLGQAEIKLNGQSNPLKAVRIDINDNGQKKYSYNNIFLNPTTARIFTQRMYHLYIPWDEIDYQKCDQNPDWSRLD